MSDSPSCGLQGLRSLTAEGFGFKGGGLQTLCACDCVCVCARLGLELRGISQGSRIRLFEGCGFGLLIPGATVLRQDVSKHAKRSWRGRSRPRRSTGRAGVLGSVFLCSDTSEVSST